MNWSGSIVAFILGLYGVQAFFPVPVQPRSSFTRRSSVITMSAERGGLSRRRLFENGAAAALGVSLGLGLRSPLSVPVEVARAAEDGPIAVLGARGKTGRLIVRGLLKLGKPVRAITREPFTFPVSEIDESLSAGLEYGLGDVTKPETLASALKGASSVVFASSASKKGGTAQQVDYVGVVNAARAAIDAGASRYLVISSGAVSRPDSFGYKITDLFGGIMGYKKKGEDEVRLLYAQAPKGLSYTIVRPGGLSNDKAAGVGKLEINQMDTIIGEISRADVAEACINALLAKDAENTTFEVYETSRRAPLQPEFPSTSGLEHHGDTWPAMLKGLKTDAELGIVPAASSA